VDQASHAATGTIVDADTGAPIAGATVLAVWYYTPFGIPLPVEGAHWPQERCGGAAVAKTGSDGKYDLGANYSRKQGFHQRRVETWIVADGYYNDWLGPDPKDQRDFAQLLSTLKFDPSRAQANKYSARLRSLVSAPIDVQLLTLSSNGARVQCLDADDTAAILRYRETVDQAIGTVACAAHAAKQMPRTDVFKVSFPLVTYDRINKPEFPRRERSRVAENLIAMACSRYSRRQPRESLP